jgi:NAD(P)-dependent dehydrogenase (short-subunit alcohol dehydrogenase family)
MPVPSKIPFVHRLPGAVPRRGLTLILPALLLAAAAVIAHGDALPMAPSDQQMVALVTGSTSGLGEAVARQLASRGAHVIVHGRNVERGEALVAEIESEGIGSASFHAADFASLDDVRALAATVRREYDRLDLLVNNAGLSVRGTEVPQFTDDGYELLLQVNYLSHFLLTLELLPLLESSAPARIIHVASGAQAPLDFDDPHMRSNFSSGRAYGQSKLAQVTFSNALAKRI